MKSANLLSAFGLFLLFVDCEASAIRNTPCAHYCTCDVFSGVTRANCSGQGVTSTKVELPYRLQELDLSFNNITTLKDSSFEVLVYLVNLTIAYNAIHTIHPEAFTPLREIVSIDLSYNRLENFDEHIFETNTKLTRLDLSGNELMELDNKPMIVSRSLVYLGLRGTNITNVYPLLLFGMSALEELEVSDNPNTTIHFKGLPELTAASLDINDWYDVFPVWNMSDIPSVQLPEVKNPHQKRLLERIALKLGVFLVFYCVFLAIGIYCRRKRNVEEDDVDDDNAHIILSSHPDRGQTPHLIIPQATGDTSQTAASQMPQTNPSAPPYTPPPSYEDVLKMHISR